MRRSPAAIHPPAGLDLRPRRWWLALLLLVPVALYFGPQALPSPGLPASGPIAFATPFGERTTGPRCFMVLIDQSGSMATSDSHGLRASATTAAASFLQRHGLAQDRIGVAWFADTVAVHEPVAPAALLASGVLTRPAPAVGGGTLIGPAVRAAGDALDACGTTQPVLVLVTDGQANGDTDFDATEEALRALTTTAHVHLIAMNEDGAFDVVGPFWQRSILASIQPISQFDRVDVARAVAHILALETGQRVEPG